MREYDVDAEFEILITILDKLKSLGFDECDKKCMAYISHRISDLLDPECSSSGEIKGCDYIVPLNLPKDYKENIIPANVEEEIHFAPDDSEYEFYSASMDDIMVPPKHSKATS